MPGPGSLRLSRSCCPRPSARRPDKLRPITEATRSVRTLAGAILVATIVGCGLSLTIALIAVRLDSAGYSARAIGLNTASGGVATLVIAPFIPWCAQKIGVARVLLIALLFGGAALLGFTLTSSYTAWLALRFVVGASVTVMFVLSEFWITTFAPPERGGLWIGIYVASLAAGFAVGPLALVAVGTTGALPFALGGALFIGAAGPLMLNAADAPALKTRSRKTLLTFLREAPVATLAALLHGAIEVAGMSLLAVYALRAGVGIANGALFASLFILGNSALQLPLGLLADRLDRRKLLLGLAAAGFVGAAFLGIVGVGNLVIFEAVLLLWGGCVGALYPVGLGLLGASYRGGDLASANAAFVMTYAVGMLAGPPIIGAGLDALSPSGFFWSIAAMIALYLVVAVAQIVRAPVVPSAEPSLTRE